MIAESELSLPDSRMPKPRPKITKTRPTKEVSVRAWIEDAEQKVPLVRQAVGPNGHSNRPFSSSLSRTSVIMRLIVERSTLYFLAT